MVDQFTNTVPEITDYIVSNKTHKDKLTPQNA